MHYLSAMLVPALVGAAPLPPGVLAPYVRNGHFEPGDYQWLRGGFDGASVAETDAYRAMVDWRGRCRTSDMAETRSELAGLGVKAGAALETIPYRSLVCDQVSSLPEPLNLHDWPGFVRDVAIVRPIVAGFLTAVSMGEKAAVVDVPDLRDALNARATGEQALRAGLLWSSDASAPDLPATLTPQQRGILTSELAIALATRDHDNTAWLKQIVASQGWPKRSRVGGSAAKIAWLLVQHADADPAFQVRALRLMEPLVAINEADSRSFAYLYDRVMLKVGGTQRYGTQLECRRGRLTPMRLESEGAVAWRRRTAGLITLAAYLKQAEREGGSCADGP